MGVPYKASEKLHALIGSSQCQKLAEFFGNKVIDGKQVGGNIVINMRHVQFTFRGKDYKVSATKNEGKLFMMMEDEGKHLMKQSLQSFEGNDSDGNMHSQFDKACRAAYRIENGNLKKRYR